MKKTVCACVLISAAIASVAQPVVAPLQNVVQLSANATVEVTQDLLSLSLSTTRDGVDASALQTQLKAALDAALVEAKKTALDGEMDVRTGQFSLSPRYGRDSRISGWQGTVELVLQGRDFARISAAAGKIQTLTVANVNFSLSREQRALAETQAQGMAIARFKTRAGEVAQSFGMGGYSLREIAVTANDQAAPPRPRMMTMEARAMSADAAVAVEAGKSTVLVNVSGTVQLK